MAGIILAAGRGRRFGGNKLLATLGDRPVIAHGLAAALASRLSPVILVLGSDGKAVTKAIAPYLTPDRCHVVHNPAPEKGQSGSVILGLETLLSLPETTPHQPAAVMYLMGDQPGLTPAIIDALIYAFQDGKGEICHPVCQGQRRTPVIFARRFFPDILRLTGDQGAREIILANPDRVCALPFADPLPFQDLDTPEDLAAMARALTQKQKNVSENGGEPA